MFIYRGIVWVISGGQMLQSIEKLLVYDIFNGRLAFLADAIEGANFRTAAIWLIGLVVVFQIVLARSRFGNHVFATGGAPGGEGDRRQREESKADLLYPVRGAVGLPVYSCSASSRRSRSRREQVLNCRRSPPRWWAVRRCRGVGSIVGALLGVLIISMLRTGVVLTNLIPADNFEAIVGVTIIGAAIFNKWIRGRA